MTTIGWGCCLISIGLLAHASGAVHYVSLQGSDDPPYLTPETAARSIQDAVDASLAGDLVLLAEGEYREAVTMRDGVALVGTADCIILPPLSQNASLLTMAEKSTIFGLSIYGDDCGVLVEGVRASITECEIGNSLSYRWGYGVRVDSGGGVVISHCRLVGNEYGLWCGRNVVAATLDCEIHDNSYGVWGSWSSNIAIAGCDIHHNCVGVHNPWGGLLTVSDCRITDNEGALGLEYGFASISDCLIVRNETGIHAYGEGPRPVLLRCTIAVNRWGISDFARATIRDSIVWGNGENVTEATDPADTSHSLIGDQRFAGVNSNLAGEPAFVGWAPFNDSDNPIHVDASAAPGGDGTVESPLTSLSAALRLYDFRLSPESPCLGAATDGSNLGAIQEVTSVGPSSRVRIILSPGLYAEARQQVLTIPSGTEICGSGDNCTIQGAGPWAFGDVLVTGLRFQEAGLSLLGGRAEDSCFENAYVGLDGGAEMSRCQFWRSAIGTAGPSLVANSTFCGSGGRLSRAITVSGTGCLITNCTLFGYETALDDWGATGVVRNCIIWGNSNSIESRLQVDVEHSLIEGGHPGEGNIDAHPGFVDAENGDFRLMPDSPCIDAGFNDPDLPETDIAGMHRIMFGGKGLTVDMGAYEFYVNKVEPVPGTDQTIFTWSSLPGKTYSIFHTEDLLTWHPAAENFPSSGNQTTFWTDDGSLTGLPPSLVPCRFYRALEDP